MCRLSLSEMKQRNKEAGYHWFSPDNMRFFGTKIEANPNELNLFVTSEHDFTGEKRLYSVRRFNPSTNHVETLGVFQEFSSLVEARAARSRYTKEIMEARSNAENE